MKNKVASKKLAPLLKGLSPVLHLCALLLLKT